MMSKITRRGFGKRMGATAVAALSAPALATQAFAQSKELNIWAYSGFVTDEFRNRFEEETGIKTNIRLVSDQGEEFNLMAAENGNFSADIVTVAGHRFYQFIDADFLAPIDTQRLENWNRIESEYAEANWVSRKSKLWGVPLVVVSTGLLYNTEYMEKPASWDVMFDEANSGRTSYQIQDFFQIVMNYLGYDGSGSSYRGDTEVTQRAIDATRDFLIEKKHLVRRYYDAATEIQQMMVNGDVMLAQAGSGPSSKLIMDGFPAGYTIPKEGGLAYAYGFNITNNAANTENAYTFLNALLASPENGAEIVRSTGLTSTILGTADLLSDAENEALVLSAEERERLSWVDVETAAFIFGLIDVAAEEIRAA